jgi:hypothetical protein
MLSSASQASEIRSRCESFDKIRDRLLKTLLRLATYSSAAGAAKAFPIASRTTDATGAMTAAVIASVVHYW